MILIDGFEMTLTFQTAKTFPHSLQWRIASCPVKKFDDLKKNLL